VKPFSSIEA